MISIMNFNPWKPVSASSAQIPTRLEMMGVKNMGGEDEKLSADGSSGTDQGSVFRQERC